MVRSATARFARKLLSSSKTPSRKPTFRPQIESLERREVLSASSPAVHAVLDNTGHSVAFYIEKASGNLYEKTNLGFLQSLGHVPAGTQFSAGLDRNGAAEVIASNGPGGSLEVYSDSNGRWLSMNQPLSFKEWAAVKGGRLYAIATNNSVWEGQAPYITTIHILGHTLTVEHPAVWTYLPGGWGLTSLDVVTDVANVDVLFGNMAGNSLNNVYEWIPGNGGTPFALPVASRNFSAGLDTNGYPDLFAVESVFGVGELVKWVPGRASVVAVWIPTNSVISAANAGGCFFTTGITSSGYNTLGEYDPSHGVTYLPPWAYANITQVSAVSENDVFSLTTTGSVQEYGNLTPGGRWFTWY